MKIALIGTGVYGLAIAMAISKNHKDITMWTESDERYEKYINDGKVLKDIIPNMEDTRRSLAISGSRWMMPWMSCTVSR